MAESPELAARIRSLFKWREDEFGTLRDFSSVLADGDALSMLGPALGKAVAGCDVILGSQSFGWILGPLVAAHLKVGFVQVYKSTRGFDIADGLKSVQTQPDKNGATLKLSIRHNSLNPFRRAAFADDWISTGAQAEGAMRLVLSSGLEFIGTTVIVDGAESGTRRHLKVTSLLREEQLQ